jgi:chloramphenicol-sensitive protein RarD
LQTPTTEAGPADEGRKETSAPEGSLIGGFYALSAFLIWGGAPIYFKAVAEVPSLEILAHRIVWSAVLVALLLFVLRRWHAVRATLTNGRLLATLTVSSLLVSINWLIFIWAVTHNRILETSLGYFINPLVLIVLGVLFLRERLNPWQWCAVLLAAAGVGNLMAQYGQLPWVALTLAVTFGLYGLIRKVAMVDAFTGLFVETLIVCPLALGYLIYLGYEGSGVFTRLGWRLDLLLVFSGVVTASPLILFAQAARHLRLSTLGFFQYIAPSMSFLLAVFIYNEPFTLVHGVTFGCIWLALVIYTADTSLRRRQPG